VVGKVPRHPSMLRMVTAVVNWVTSQHMTQLAMAVTNHSILISDEIRSEEMR